MDVLAAATPRVRLLTELGAERPFVVAGHRGHGPVPEPEEAEVALLGTGGDTMIASIRAAEAGFANPGPEVEARLDAWDPTGEARVYGAFYSAGESVCGRPYWGGRPAAWRALEDKMLAESVWDAAGVPRAAARVVAAEPVALIKASRALDAGAGVVWAGDMREGFNGGAEYVRWIRSEADAEREAGWFGARCDRVRVMPFLDGLPCSIHGIVVGDTVIAVRPCEMVVLRAPGSTRFRYASAATFWEPHPDDTEAMRDVARRVGAHLRARVGYRGAFTVDGVMTADGFRPTELNPRIGAALMGLARGVPELPLELMNLAIVAGEDVDWTPKLLERTLLEGSRLTRHGASSVVIEKRVEEGRVTALVLDGAAWREVDPEGTWDVKLSLGPHPTGGFLSVALDPMRTPVGPPVSPRVASALRWVDAAWDLGIGPVEAAPERRARAGAR